MPKDTTLPSKPSVNPTPYARPAAGPSAPAEAGQDLVPTPFTLGFGKHRGTLLSAVDPAYVRWMITAKAYTTQQGLETALEEHKLMNGDGTPTRATAVVGAPTLTGLTATDRQRLAGWRMPARPTTNRFTDMFEFEEERWVTSRDAKQFYKLDASILRAAGLRRYPGGKTERWFEWQVNALAEYMKPAGFASGASSSALAVKNYGREREIMCEMGLGGLLSCCD